MHHAIENLKGNIRQEVAVIFAAMLQHVFAKFEHRMSCAWSSCFQQFMVYGCFSRRLRLCLQHLITIGPLTVALYLKV
jgi:hypothetical protein